MALGFPRKKKSRIEEEGGENAGEIVTVCFTWAFAQQPKQQPHLRAKFVSMRGPKARGGTRRGEAEVR